MEYVKTENIKNERNSKGNVNQCVDELKLTRFRADHMKFVKAEIITKSDSSIGSMNQGNDDLKLTGFIADHSGMCQNRDHKEGMITHRGTLTNVLVS